MSHLPARRSFLKAGAAAAVVILTGCTSEPGSPTTGTAAPTGTSVPAANLTFTMGTAANPAGLDPALLLDSESFRVTRQIMETLIGVDPDTGVPKPQLATEWEELDDGRAYLFRLREGVVFHDGTPFDAEAVKANFERWYRLPRDARPAEAALSFASVFEAFADEGETSLYKDCEVLAPNELRLNLNRRFSGLVAALSTPAFAIASPAALADGNADELNQERGGIRLSAFAQHPVGTGPFRFEAWSEEQVKLTAFENYWGPAAQAGSVVFQTLPHPAARLRALQSGRIDGYDLVTPETYAGLARSGMQILQRDPFSVSYLGMNQQFGLLADLRMRQAIAHAIDRSVLIEDFFLQGTTEAKQFVPRSLGVTGEDIPYFEYNPERARELLEEAGYDGEEIPFYYPLNVTRAYLPTPEKIYAELSRQLTAVGVNIQPKPLAWEDGYLDRVQTSSDHALHLGGWSGSYRDPDNFLGPLFGAPSPEFGFKNGQLFNRIARARTLPAGEERNQAYLTINNQVARLVPAVPLAFPVSALAMGARVASYPASPMLDEVYNLVRLRTDA